MKKTYIKPELFCEEYELSVSIAGNCGKGFGAYNVTSSTYLTCGYKMGRGIVYVTENYCNIFPAVEGGKVEGIDTFCYQVLSPTELAFSS